MAQIKTIRKDDVVVYATTKLEEAMTFDIRGEDAKPFMGALFNLINSI